jgi:hypothetical protein
LKVQAQAGAKSNTKAENNGSETRFNDTTEYLWKYNNEIKIESINKCSPQAKATSTLTSIP